MKDFEKVKEALEKIALISENRVANEPDVTHDTTAFLKIGDAAREALAELETPADNDAYDIALKILSMGNSQSTPGNIADIIEQYAESRCHTCPKLKNALDTHTRDRDAEIERIAEKE